MPSDPLAGTLHILYIDIHYRYDMNCIYRQPLNTSYSVYNNIISITIYIHVHALHSCVRA